MKQFPKQKKEYKEYKRIEKIIKQASKDVDKILKKKSSFVFPYI